jgi:hypothetical protein
MGGGQHRSAGLDGGFGVAGVDDCRRQQPNAPVAMLLVVPVEEPAAEVEAVVIAGEPVREARPVL